MINFIRDFYAQETIDLFTSIMMQDKPLFVTRVGGNEYDACLQYFGSKDYFKHDEHYQFHLKRMRGDTGYFDFSNSKERFIDFINVQTRCYKDAEYSFFANGRLVWPILEGKLPDAAFLTYLLDGKTSICYGFVEGSTPFLNSFKAWGEGKKILIISPFEESVKYQYARKNDLLIDYTFPEFELVTYKTKVLYNFESDTKESLGVDTDNWEEEWRKMAGEISQLDFDIAWLSCASYANVLGDYIAHQIGKKAVYIGGMLNMFFNIYGGRYVAYTGRRTDTMIDAFENKEIEHIKAGRQCEHEAVNAYFGYRK